MTWDSTLKAIIPSIQSAIYALLAMILGVGGTMAVNREKPAPEVPIAQKTVPVRTVQVDQTRMQLVGLQHTLDQIAEGVREINGKDCVPKPTKAAAKAK
jgi:hypothetical protein